MSRKIKFRAWDKVDKEYRHDINIALTLEGELYAVWAYHPQKITSNIYIIEQYTGLKDKNGKKIYEGDIIREKWYDNDVNRSRDRIGKIEYFCDRFVCWFGGTFVDLGMFPSENIEVIGNIHENSELLEERKC